MAMDEVRAKFDFYLTFMKEEDNPLPGYNKIREN